MPFLGSLLLPGLVASGEPGRFVEDFSASAALRWTAPGESSWSVEQGALRSPLTGGLDGMLLAPVTARDVRATVDLRLPTEGRRNPGLVFRFGADGSGWVVRWYDAQQWLELLRYERGEVLRTAGNHWQACSPRGSAPQTPGAWYTFEVAAIGERVRARVWPRGTPEPEWLLDAACPDLAEGAVGVSADESALAFDHFVALTGEAVADLVREEERVAAMDQARRESVTLLRRDVGPYPHCEARFRLQPSADPAEVVFLAADADNYYFARATEGRLQLGKAIEGHEVLLGQERCAVPAEACLLSVRVEPSDRDGSGPAWFLNADRVPPILRITAELRGAATLSVVDDPVIPGQRGERYWDPDPFASSSARYPFGPHCGRREAGGVRWLGLQCRPQPPARPACPTLEPVLRIRTGERGGCWLALGDLTGDGRLDFLVARHDNQAVTALTAYANDGRELWRWGEGGTADIFCDIPATVYDLDGDGRAEALLSIHGFLLLLDGATGSEKARYPLPPGLDVADCLLIANLRGAEHPRDLVLKTRYDHLWACDDRLNVLWDWHGNTGHAAAARDIDGDGRDEVLCGYALFDHDGRLLWELPLPDHADTTRLTELRPGGPIRAVLGCGGGNEMVIASVEGEILHRPQPPLTDFHFQTINVGNVRRDLEGCELIVDDGWARPGRAQLALYDSRLRRIGTYYSAYQRFARLVEWGGVERIVMPADGLIVDGRGHPVARFADPPPFGGPGAESPMARTADVDGDGQDEVILYNAEEIVVYRNPDSPATPRHGRPAAQPRLYNFTYY